MGLLQMQGMEARSSMTRFEFSLPQKREMRARSKDVCEAGKEGTEAFYGMAKGETCKRKAEEFDHVIADGLKREKPRSADDGLHVCLVHHKIKTHGHDRPKIAKAKRIDEKLAGITPIKTKITSRPFQSRLKPDKSTRQTEGQSKHIAAMAARGKPIVPRRIT